MITDDIKQVLVSMSRKELNTVMMATLSAMKELTKKELLEKIQTLTVGEPVSFVCQKKKSSFFGKQVTGILKEVSVKWAMVEAPDKGTWSVSPMKLQKVG